MPDPKYAPYVGEHSGCGGRVLRNGEEVYCAECGQSNKRYWRHKGTGQTMEPAQPEVRPKKPKSPFYWRKTNQPAPRKKEVKKCRQK